MELEREERMKKIREHMVAFNALARELQAAGCHISGWDLKTDQTAIGMGEGPDARIVGYINRDLSIEWKEGFDHERVRTAL